MAKENYNSTIVTVGVVCLMGFAAWKLLPKLASKLGSSGSSSGTSGSGSASTEADQDYYQPTDSASTNNSLLNQIGSLLKVLLGGKSGGSSAAKPGGSDASGMGKTGAAADGTFAAYETSAQVLDNAENAYSDEAGAMLDNGAELGNVEAAQASSYQLDYQPMALLNVTGTEIPYGAPENTQNSYGPMESQGGSIPEASGVIASNGDQPGASNYTGQNSDTIATYGDETGYQIADEDTGTFYGTDDSGINYASNDGGDFAGGYGGGDGGGGGGGDYFNGGQSEDDDS